MTCWIIQMYSTSFVRMLDLEQRTLLHGVQKHSLCFFAGCPYHSAYMVIYEALPLHSYQVSSEYYIYLKDDLSANSFW